MKKFLFVVCLLVVSLGAKAQFEQGTWVVNPYVTGLGFSYSKNDKAQFGFGAKAGNFLVDNVALLVELNADWSKPRDTYSVGAGGRYYFDKTGVYLGAGLRLDHTRLKGGHKDTGVGLGVEGGYAFFVSKTVTIEPAVYYNWMFSNNDLSKFGIKVGFGLYF